MSKQELLSFVHLEHLFLFPLYLIFPSLLFQVTRPLFCLSKYSELGMIITYVA